MFVELIEYYCSITIITTDKGKEEAVQNKLAITKKETELIQAMTTK